jgi:hypothetical protein
VAARKGRKRKILVQRLTPEQRPVRFSFKHLDLDNPKFQCSECSKEFFEELLACLHMLSTWSIEVFRDQNNNQHRHVIDFMQTSEPDGFLGVPNIDPEQFGFHESWQFSVCPDDHANQGRVHGVLIDDTFFVVWLDHHHRLFTTQA